jgi:two-component system, chemotaxis family, chemotaxis protein CheY
MRSVLIIDDEADIRDSVRQLLTRAGYEVRTANNGSEGIAAYRRASADLVITDMIMPKGHGLDAIKTLRSDFPQARIIAVSGGGNFGPQSYKSEAITTTAYLAAAAAAGADIVLTKPFDRKTLLDAVYRLCPPGSPE